MPDFLDPYDDDEPRTEKVARHMARLNLPGPPSRERPPPDLKAHDALFGLDHWSPERIAELGYPGAMPLPDPLPEGVDAEGDDNEARED